MKVVKFEINENMPSQNVWERMNIYKKPKEVLRYRDNIILQCGEGPYKKAYLLGRKYPSAIRKQVVEQLRKEWPKKYKAFVEVTVRRPGRCDTQNYIGGCKPLLDAIQWAGWCVTDHCKWLKVKYHDQVIGDGLTIVGISIPENDEELAILNSKYGEGEM